MNCSEAREFASGDLDDRLDSVEREALESHLQGCSDCSTFAGEIRENREALQKRTVKDPGTEFTRKVMASVRRRRPFPVGWAVAAAAAALLVALTLVLVPGSKPTESARDLLARQIGPAWVFYNQLAHLEEGDPKASLQMVRDEFDAAGLRDRTRRAREARGDLPAGAGDYLRRSEDLESKVWKWATSDEPSPELVARIRNEVRDSRIIPELKSIRKTLAPVSEPTASVEVSDDAQPVAYFQAGRRNLYAADYEAAAREFERYMKKAPKGELFDDSLYWLAYCHEQSGRKEHAMGKYVSLSRLRSDWMTAEVLEDAKLIADLLAAEHADGSFELEVWGEEAGDWESMKLETDRFMKDFDRRMRDGDWEGVESYFELEWEGKMYRFRSLDDFRKKEPKVVGDIERTAPELIEAIRGWDLDKKK